MAKVISHKLKSIIITKDQKERRMIYGVENIRCTGKGI